MGPISSRHHRHRRAFTLVEAVLSMLIVAVMYVSVLNSVGAARAGQRKIGDSRQGQILAEQLMEEILLCEYEDAVSPDFGPEADEVGRDDYDDLDDYGGWQESPPEHRDGTAMTDLSDWKRKVDVFWTEATNLTSNSSSETGLKRIRVEVTRNGVPVAELVVIRSSSRHDPLAALEDVE